jgi:alpha-tubulin suppressor-like RCC1 family protein
LTDSGGVKSWGYNADGELGNDDYSDSSIPVDVSGLTSGVMAISAGMYHSCAVTQGGGVKCWGYNGYGQLGDGTYDDSPIPVDVAGLSSGVASVTAGEYHTCALTQSGGVKCWGDNNYGQLGDGTTIDKLTPVDVSGLTSGVAAVSAGGYHTCALTQAGGVKCWGYNSYGQLGDGTTTRRTTPVNVTGLTSGASAVSAGGYHTCALTQSGGVKCWGYNSYGQLGDNTTTRRTTPVDVSGLTSGVSAVSGGNYHTCALTQAGGIKCWGSNEYGQIGDGTTVDRTTPINVLGLTSEASAISGGYEHTCAVTQDGGIKCWGNSYYGELGDSEIGYRTTPVDVLGLTLW